MARKRMTDEQVAEKLGSKLEQFVIWKDDGCWWWKGFIHRSGYGAYGSRIAHRLVWVYFRGRIDEGLELDHLCRVRRCVNPDHLEPVTRLKNLSRIPNRTGPQPHLRGESCKRGHPFSGNNLYVSKAGARLCRACRRQHAAAFRVRSKGKRAPRIRVRLGKYFPGQGPGAAQRAKQFCPHGHPYSKENTYVTKRGGRICRQCTLARNRERYARTRSVLESL